jgi:general stress protein 26
MTTDDAKRTCLSVMEKADVAVLATIDEGGYPHTRGMLNLRHSSQFPALAPLFAAHDDDMLVYITTNTASAKVRQLAANAKVSVYYCLPGSYYGVTLLGVAEIVQDVDEKQRLWMPGWEMYYVGGVSDPDYTVIRLRPSKARLYHGLETADIDL